MPLFYGLHRRFALEELQEIAALHQVVFCGRGKAGRDAKAKQVDVHHQGADQNRTVKEIRAHGGYCSFVQCTPRI